MIKPLGNRILIKVEEPKAGNLHVDIPVAQEQGEVVAVGNDWNITKEPLKVGDIIHFKSWACDLVTIEGKKYIYINQDTKGVLGIVK